jgi:putative phosphoribosyl transferase
MFANREAAGLELRDRLMPLQTEKPIVLALPRGGVPIAAVIAEGLKAPLDVVLVRKIGVPWQPELALGAVVDGDEPQVFINRVLATELAIEESYIDGETAHQLAEIERRRQAYFGDREPIPVAGRTVILVDDGIATGSTMRIAARAVRKAGAARIVIAVPVAPEDTVAELRTEADEMVCLDMPHPFLAVGAHYAEFPQLSDEDVIAILARRRASGG